jgi:hypothetical protein
VLVRALGFHKIRLDIDEGLTLVAHKTFHRQCLVEDPRLALASPDSEKRGGPRNEPN